MTVEWRGPQYQRELAGRLTRNMAAATLYLKGEVQRAINRGQPIKRYPSGATVGLDPSKPGEPPKKVTTRLFQSIAVDQRVSPLEITGIVGTNVEYARRLELGFVGTDSAGRTIDQAPRPFLRSTLTAKLARIRQLLVRE